MMVEQQPGVRVQYDAAASFLRAAWVAGQPLEQFRPALEALMRLSREQHVTRWLIDMHNIPPLGPTEQVWIGQEWFAEMARTPVEQLALVLPPDMHNYLVATAPVHDASLQPSFDLHFFTDAASAFHWLLEAMPHHPALWAEWQQPALCTGTPQ
ncbi:hypothetical protein [Hymenobacter rigui]|uniref:STAS/SEC14 domain-containing protein n=1 Tax=Hymenobacter rigui TaxID=334424 RepID=A0A428KRY9_9BACT|nr:hypothetical protein [Hymenobacter rigui]RSK49285.1 hypothetical protein EI291_07235 [Hymenobacter rigui]